MDSCLADERCVAFTYDRENRFDNVNCWLKDAAANLDDYKGMTSGVRCDLEDAPKYQAHGKYPGETSLYILIIVENRAADEFRAAPSEGAASAFRFDQS